MFRIYNLFYWKSRQNTIILQPYLLNIAYYPKSFCKNYIFYRNY